MDHKQDHSKLKVGQRLWYKNKHNDKFGFVLVEQIFDDCFAYRMSDEKLHKGYFDWIGKRLYLSLFDIPSTQYHITTIRSTPPVPPKKQAYQSQIVYPPPPLRKASLASATPPPIPEPTPPTPPRTPSCDICALRKNGTCGSLSNQLCEDFKPTQFISKEDVDSFPEFGDATAFRLKKWKR